MRLTPTRRARTTPAMLLVLLFWLLLSLHVQPAHAAGPLPNMRVTIIPYATYHQICVHGDASGIVVTWQLTISGAGTNHVIAPVFLPFVGARYDHCHYVWKNGGNFAYGVTLTGVPVGSTTAPWITEAAGIHLFGQDYFHNSGS